jgi:hypothetical protein
MYFMVPISLPDVDEFRESELNAVETRALC